MPSIIEGYSYDIFISYRQKDNKYDSWVSGFVDNLKKELEATFKEEVSVYVDINPHDGLLETHNVDASLKEKLKCLVFIPIISRTYCDQKSFAWVHEFCAFNKMAKEDKFGRDIRLIGGNVTSRILPIKIYDLDPEDMLLLETELNGVFRCIEFIYKSAGVNRPLRASEDNPHENLKKTCYRDQINKVSNTIKGIITTLKKHNYTSLEASKTIVEGESINIKQSELRTLSSEPIEKSIAVLPFKNDSPDEQNTYFINGIMEEILCNLQTIKDLRVISRTSVEQYRNQTKDIPTIARDLGVNYIVEGSGQKYASTFRLRIQLILAEKESHLWGESYQQKITDVEDIFKIQSHIAGAIAKELKVIITPHETDLIEKIPATKLEAYDAYLKGLFFYDKNEEVGTEKAILWFKEAIRLDSTFALPWTYLSMCYWRLSSTADTPEFKEAKRAAKRALELDLTLSIAIVNMAEILDNEYDFEGAEEKIKLALKMDPDNQYVLRNAGRFYTKLGRRDDSISFCNRAIQNDPNNRAVLYYLTFAYFYADCFTEAWATLKKHHELEYTGHNFLYYQLLLQESNFDRIIKEPSFEGDDNARNVALTAVNFALGKKNEAEKLCDILKKRKIPAYWIALAYSFGDVPSKVFKWLERSYMLKEKELTYIGVEPAFKKFSYEPRVMKLLQKLKFPA